MIGSVSASKCSTASKCSNCHGNDIFQILQDNLRLKVQFKKIIFSYQKLKNNSRPGLNFFNLNYKVEKITSQNIGNISVQYY